jgi:hypothetical protein
VIPGYYAEQALKYWAKNFKPDRPPCPMKDLVQTFTPVVKGARRILAPPYGMILKPDYDHYPLREHIYLPFFCMTVEYAFPALPEEKLDTIKDIGECRFVIAFRIPDTLNEIGVVSVYKSEVTMKGGWAFGPFIATVKLDDPWEPNGDGYLSPKVSLKAIHRDVESMTFFQQQKERVKKHVEAGVWVVINSCLVINLPKEKEDVTREHTPSRLKAGMFRKNKIPVKDYRIVDCYMPTKDIPKANREAVLEYCYRGRTGPRRHMVRRSLRHLADGRVVWVREHERGNALKGEVETRYRVHGEKHTRQ